MFALMPWLKPEDTPFCRSWAQFEFLGDQVYAGLRADGVLNGQGESRLLDDFRRLRLAQATYAPLTFQSPAAKCGNFNWRSMSPIKALLRHRLREPCAAFVRIFPNTDKPF
jgi:hypothetical protein